VEKIKSNFKLVVKMIIFKDVAKEKSAYALIKN
jgi:hypothetical protein